MQNHAKVDLPSTTEVMLPIRTWNYQFSDGHRMCIAVMTQSADCSAVCIMCASRDLHTETETSLVVNIVITTSEDSEVDSGVDDTDYPTWIASLVMVIGSALYS